MHSNFAAVAKAARASIEVPALPREGIERRSFAARRAGRIRSVLLCATIGLGAVAGAAATEMHRGIQFWLSGGRASLSIHSFAIDKMPTAARLRAIIASATFPVVLPVGLPDSSRLVRVIYAPADRPNALSLEYWNGRSHAVADFMLVAASAVNDEQLPPPGSARSISNIQHWSVGSEIVFGGGDDTRTKSIQTAMRAATPASSLNENAKRATALWVLGGSYETAELARSLASSGVLIDVRTLETIPALAAAGRPLVAARTTYLQNIPLDHGEPQYGKATLRWDQGVAVSVAGVRAIAAAMARVPQMKTNCCAVLFVQRAAAATIWTIPISANGRPREFAIPADRRR